MAAVPKRSHLWTVLSGTGAKRWKSEQHVWQTAKDKALVMEGGDKNLTLCRFWQLYVILSMQGKGRKSQRGQAATGKNCFFFLVLPVLFFLSILTSHFRETKIMEADKKLFQLRLILSSPYRGIQEALHSLVSLFEVSTYHPPLIKI